MEPRISGAICLVILLTILMAGLWPFDFSPGNEVRWLPDRNGVHFYGQGMIVGSDTRNQEQKTLFPDRSITLELWLRPLLEPSNLPCILTLYDGHAPDILFVGQWRTHLIIRSRTDKPLVRRAGKPYQETGVRNTLLKNRDVFITMTSGPDGSVIYVNGHLERAYPRRHLPVEAAAGDLRMILGCTSTGENCWNGNLLGLAVYNRALSADQVFSSYETWTGQRPLSNLDVKGCLGMYPFQEKSGTVVQNACGPEFALAIPATFQPLERTILRPLWQDFRWNWPLVSDVAVNIAGFIPLGFFFPLFFCRSTQLRQNFLFAAVLLTGFGLSLAIELTQVYLPTRNSQSADLVCNIAGTILGLMIFCIFHRYYCKRPGECGAPL